MKVLLVLSAIFLSLTSAASAGTIVNPVEIGGVGTLRVTAIERQTGDAFCPTEVMGYRVVLDGCAIDDDSTQVVFEAVVTDSTYFQMDGHDDVWTSVQFRDNCLVTIRATWERDGHRLVGLDVGYISMYPQIHRRTR